MKTIIKLLLTLALSFNFASSAAAITAISYLNIPLDAALLADVDAQYDEGVAAPAALIDPSIDVNIHLSSEAEVIVVLVDSETAYNSTLGYFTFEDSNNDNVITSDEILTQETIFSNANIPPLNVGDAANLGIFPAGTNIGFFIHPNGNTQITYYSVDSLNNNNERRVSHTTAGNNDRPIIGFEDLPLDQADKDYGDNIITYKINPTEGTYYCNDTVWHFNDENDANGDSILYAVNPVTGVATQIDAYQGIFFSALAVDTSGLHYTLQKMQDGIHLVRLEDGGVIVDLGNIGFNISINSLTMTHDGILYGFDERGQDLYSINPADGLAVLVYDYPKKSNYFSGGDLVINEHNEIIYVRVTGEVYVIDLANPADISLVSNNPLPGSGHNFTSLGYLNGVYHPLERNDDAFYSFDLINGNTELIWSSIENVGPFSYGDAATCGVQQVTPTPTPSVQPTPPPSVQPSPTPAVQPTPTPSVQPTPPPSVQPTPTPAVQPTPTPSVQPTPPPSVQPTPTPSESPNPNGSPEPTPTPDVTPTPSSTPTATTTPVATPDNTTGENNNTPGTSAAGNTPLGLFIEGDSKCSLNKSDGFNSSSTGFAGIALLLTSLVFIRRKHN